MNAANNSKHNPFDSKTNPDKTYSQLFKFLLSSVSKELLEQDHHQASQINDDAMEIIDKITELFNEREEKLKNENEKFKSITSEISAELEQRMANTLQESMETGVENLDNWKILAGKKENFEVMHQNLLQMKKNILPFAFFKRQNK